MVATLETSPSVAARERDLAIRAKAGDRDALADLLAMHDGFFRAAALRCGLDPNDDGAQEARMAAIQALATYDPYHGVRFLTYASKKIHWVLRHVRDYDRTIRPPHWQNVSRANASAVTKERARLARRTVSLDVPRDGDGGETWGAAVPDRADVIESVIRTEDVARVKAALSRIPERERDVLSRRLAGEMLREIGDSLRLSKERVRQIEEKAIESLRNELLRPSFLRRLSA